MVQIERGQGYGRQMRRDSALGAVGWSTLPADPALAAINLRADSAAESIRPLGASSRDDGWRNALRASALHWLRISSLASMMSVRRGMSERVTIRTLAAPPPQSAPEGSCAGYRVS